MTRRILAAALATLLALGAMSPALAEDVDIAASSSAKPVDTPVPISVDGAAGDTSGESNAEELARVTIAAKTVLGIGDEYEDFAGYSQQDGPLTFWNLQWSNEGDSISVTTDSDGKVLSYNRYIDSSSVSSSYYGDYSPRFPANSREAALEVAGEFVAPLLGDIESLEWDELSGVRPLSVSSYTFSGAVLLNGVPSPITFSVRVNAETLVVTRFSRSDSYSMVVPGVPSAEAPADIGAASEALKGAYTLELQYVLDDDKNPVLRYVLTDSKDLLVDAKTGEVIDVNALLSGDLPIFGDMDTGKNEAMESAPTMAGGLSQVELDAIAKLEGVLPIEELEAAARGISELGLDEEFVLASNSFSRVSSGDEEDETDDEVTVQLRFVRDTEQDEMIYRTTKRVTLDAKSGGFKYVSGSSGVPAEGDAETLEATARAFAEKYFEHFDGYELYSSGDTRFTFCRYENGVPFVNDAVNVSLDASDGSILSYNASYTEGLSFPSPEGVVGMDAALDAYFGEYDVMLCYAELPVAVTPQDIEPLRAAFANAGYGYVYEYRLVYGAERRGGYILGVDAMSGEALVRTYSELEPFVYTDLDTSYAAEIIATLGEYGIGLAGEEFKPVEALNQLDMLALLLSAVGYRFDDSSEESVERIYEAAEIYGIEFAERDPEAAVTRVELVRTLVTMTEYGEAAKLEDIWAPGFVDDDEIAAGDLGYVAIAKALGLVQGDGDRCFNPNDAITRQDAAIVLYNFLGR